MKEEDRGDVLLQHLSEQGQGRILPGRMPERQQAHRDLGRLSEKLGEEGFASAVAAVQADRLETGQFREILTVKELLQVVVNNTVAVLTQMPEKKAEWREALEKLEIDLKYQGEDKLVVFVSLTRRLVESVDSEQLTPDVLAD